MVYLGVIDDELQKKKNWPEFKGANHPYKPWYALWKFFVKNRKKCCLAVKGGGNLVKMILSVEDIRQFIILIGSSFYVNNLQRDPNTHSWFTLCVFIIRRQKRYPTTMNKTLLYGIFSIGLILGKKCGSFSLLSPFKSLIYLPPI